MKWVKARLGPGPLETDWSCAPKGGKVPMYHPPVKNQVDSRRCAVQTNAWLRSQRLALFPMV